jgi:hypothetical protein
MTVSLVLITLVNRLKDAIQYITKVNEVITNKLETNPSESEKREYIQAEKENKYHKVLITLIESIYKREEKLNKNFLKELSNTILKVTLTDDLQISGMIHGLIINYTQSFSSIINYFKDFVEFFQKTHEPGDKVNQICYINSVLETINLILFISRKDKTIDIEGDRHHFLFDLVFTWLTSLKQGKTTKSDNILYILIKTIKNVDFLIVLKLIYLGVLKYVLDKRNITSSLNDDIFEQIKYINTEFYRIESLINENKNNPKFNDITIVFKEDKGRIYKFEANHLEFFERGLYELINKCERKIIKYGKYNELEYLERRINLLFFDNKSFNYTSEGSECSIVNEYTQYFRCVYEAFKIKFHRCDLIQDVTTVADMYREFKSLMNQVILLRLIYILNCKDMNIEASILLQYTTKLDYDLAYKLLKKNIDNHNIDRLQYIWKITYFELLANTYHNSGKQEHLSVVSDLIRRTSNHQYFKKHPLRKLFKILNFIKFIEHI